MKMIIHLNYINFIDSTTRTSLNSWRIFIKLGTNNNSLQTTVYHFL
jgi:hypothetical protein